MHLIDLHCDMIWKLLKDRAEGKEVDICRNEGAVSLLGLEKAESMAQFFAAFVYMGKFQGKGRWSKGYREALMMLKALDEEIERTEGKIEWAQNAGDVLGTHRQGKIAAIKSVEEGGVLEEKISRLETFYEEGVRLLTLTWNEENCIGYPNSRDRNIMEKGLKKFGMEVVSFMNEKGMIIDVSHLSDQGFWDVICLSKAPVVASHSNARSLCAHPRNLTDEMLLELGNHGGVVGLNLYPYFVDKNGRSNMEKLAVHLRHMVSVAGEDAVAIGTDFDGFDEGISSIKNIGQMPDFYDYLKKHGFTEKILEKVWYKNALRIMAEVMK